MTDRNLFWMGRLMRQHSNVNWVRIQCIQSIFSELTTKGAVEKFPDVPSPHGSEGWTVEDENIVPTGRTYSKHLTAFYNVYM